MTRAVQKQVAILSSLFVLAGCGAAVRTTAKPAAPADSPDPLTRANQKFHVEYAGARGLEQATLGASRPYLTVGGGKLTLRYGGVTEERSLASRRFDAVKDASHVALTAISAVLAKDDARAVEVLLGQLREVEPAIRAAKLNDAEPAAIAVTRASIALLEGALAKPPTEADLHAFGLQTRTDTTTLLQAGCDDFLQTLDTAVRQVRPRAGDAWGSAVVVITTDHQSRAEEVAVQYFEHLFHEKAREGALGESRILLVENLGPNDGPVQAMASHLYDQHLSVLLFDDPTFLQGDVLGKHAEPTLARLLATPM